MASSGSHTAALRSAPAGASSPGKPQVALCTLLVLNSSAKGRGCTPRTACHQKGTQRSGRGSAEAATRSILRSTADIGIRCSNPLPLSSPLKQPRSGRHQSPVHASSAEPSQGSTGGVPQQQTGGSGGEGPKQKQDAAREALRVLDQQLADLAGEPPPRPPRVGDAAWRADASASNTATKQPSIGPDSSPDDWPEFDATFFTYSSLILLVLTAIVNWTFSALGPKEDPLNSEVIAAKQEKRDRRAALYLRALGDDSAPEMSAPDVKVEVDSPTQEGM